MAADAVGEDFEEGGEGPPKKKFSGKKLILFIVLPLLLLIGVGVGVYFSGLLGSKPEPVDTAQEAAPPPPPTETTSGRPIACSCWRDLA